MRLLTVMAVVVRRRLGRGALGDRRRPAADGRIRPVPARLDVPVGVHPGHPDLPTPIRRAGSAHRLRHGCHRDGRVQHPVPLWRHARSVDGRRHHHARPRADLHGGPRPDRVRRTTGSTRAPWASASGSPAWCWSWDPSSGASAGRLAGDLMFIAGALTWAMYTLISRRATVRLHPAHATLLATLAGTFMLLPLAIVERGWEPLLGASTRGLLSIAYLGVIGTAVAFATFSEGVRRIGSGRAAAIHRAGPRPRRRALRLAARRPDHATRDRGRRPGARSACGSSRRRPLDPDRTALVADGRGARRPDRERRSPARPGQAAPTRPSDRSRTGG